MTRLPRLILALGLLLGCGGPARLAEQAGDLATASHAAEGRADFDAALRLAEEAALTADRIPVEHPEADLASEVTKGTLRVGPWWLRELREVVLPRVRLHALALTDVAAAAVVVAASAPGDAPRDAALVDVAARLKDARALAAAVTLAQAPEARARIALFAARVAPKEAALGAIEAALMATRSVLEVAPRSELMVEVATAFKAIGRFDRGVDVARAVLEPDRKAQVLIELGYALAAADRGDEASTVLEEALDAADGIPAVTKQAAALVSLAEVYARGNAMEGATKLFGRAIEALRGEPPLLRDRVLAEVVRAAGQWGDADHALAALAAIDAADVAAGAVAAMARACDRVESAPVLVRSVEPARALPQDDAGARAGLELAVALSRLGRPVEALEAGRRIRMPEHRAAALVKVARDNPAARAEALEAARQILDATQRVGAVAAVAYVLGKPAGQPVLDEAVKDAAAAQTPYGRAARYLAVSVESALAGDGAMARSALGRALTEGAAIEDAVSRASMLALVAVELVKADDLSAGGAALAQAVEATRAIEFEGARVTVLVTAADLAAKVALGDAACTRLGEALDRVLEPERRVAIARALSVAWVHAGRIDDAAAVARRLPTPGLVADALGGVAEAAARAGSVARAVALLDEIPDPAALARGLARVAAARTGDESAEPALRPLLARRLR